MTDAAAVFDDLRDEGDELDRLVADLPGEHWAAPTPAPGWSIAHQIAHLAWTDDRTLLAATDPEAFAEDLVRAAATITTYVDEGAAAGAVVPPADLPSMATARLMETWAHALDVADALGVRREPTARLRHIARLAARTRDFAYGVRAEQPPAEQFRVELTGPGGESWAFGPEDATQRVTGPALDFCLLAAQRVHRDDTALVAVGRDADHWLDIAQMFAGPPGEGRKPGERA